MSDSDRLARSSVLAPSSRSESLNMPSPFALFVLRLSVSFASSDIFEQTPSYPSADDDAAFELSPSAPVRPSTAAVALS